MFFELKEIKKKALRVYDNSKLFSACIGEVELFPYKINLKKVKQSDVLAHYDLLQQEINELKRSGLKINYEAVNYKSIGSQNMPLSVEWDTQDNFLKFINKRGEFATLLKNYQLTIELYPSLKLFFIAKSKLIINNASKWKQLLEVCRFFKEDRHKNLYIRELSIENVDTKFIEKNRAILDTLLSQILDKESFDASVLGLSDYGFERKYMLKYPLPQVRFRILDDSLKIARLSDITLPVDEFEKLDIGCDTVFIVENKITMLAFPQVTKAIVVFGSGYSVGSLKNVEWFREKKIYYWGDIDRDGFAILSQIRGYFRHVQSIMMDKKSIELFKNLSIKDSKMDANPKVLQHLTQKEQELYQDVCETEFRLEQERLDFEYVKKIIKTAPNFV